MLDAVGQRGSHTYTHISLVKLLSHNRLHQILKDRKAHWKNQIHYWTVCCSQIPCDQQAWQITYISFPSSPSFLHPSLYSAPLSLLMRQTLRVWWHFYPLFFVLFCHRVIGFMCLFVIMRPLQCKQQRDDWRAEVVVTCVCVTAVKRKAITVVQV